VFNACGHFPAIDLCINNGKPQAIQRSSGG
jgi:hypothetical protein